MQNQQPTVLAPSPAATGRGKWGAAKMIGGSQRSWLLPLKEASCDHLSISWGAALYMRKKNG